MENHGYLSLSDIGYETATGFKGINCRHDWRPYYKGSTRTYTDKELQQMNNEKVTYNGKQISKYDAQQIQRSMEKQIRQDKKDIAGLQGILTSNNKDNKLIEKTRIDLINTQSKLKLHNSSLNDFIEQTKFRKDNSRLMIGNISTNATKNDKIISKLGNNNKNSIGGTGKGTFIEKINKKDINTKLREYEKEIRNKSIEYGVLIDEKCNVYAYTGDKTNLAITDRSLKNVILTHNHPEIGSFGKDDYVLLYDNPNIKELRAVDNEYNYKLKLLKPLDKHYNEIYRESGDIMRELLDEEQHCVMLKLKELGYIEYDRTRKK